ncbi:recombinase family protein [Candidatus Berkelbacteria bacterium]|nr:recombinase family protein [Candidatus Berkelbacteria bacterium]
MEKETPLTYCLYARKSSESDERQAMSVDSQIKEMEAIAERDGIKITEVLKESHSAKDSGQRPTFNQLISELGAGKYNGILTWAPDRLSRNAGDLGSLVDLMDQGKLKEIRTNGQIFKNSPNEKFLLMILCSQAKLENDNKSINVKRGIKSKCEQGWRPGKAPLGYINRAFGGVKDIIPDPERAEFIPEVFSRAAQGWSGRRIKKWLDTTTFTNRSGNRLTLSQIFLILNNTFYYGEFEYPERSGKWFKGAHKALVSKELFEQVKANRSVINKTKWGSKNFAFKGIFKCGSCGSDITAEEKFKPLKDGSLRRHVYYHCTRQVKYDCPEKYVNEKILRKKLLGLVKKSSEKITITTELKRNVENHFKIIEYQLRKNGLSTTNLNPFAEYVEFILENGSYSDQGDVVRGIRSQFIIKSKNLFQKI